MTSRATSAQGPPTVNARLTCFYLMVSSERVDARERLYDE